jgi:hypothetical protein
MTEPLSSDRIAATLRAIILAECPGLVYAATYEYAVTSVNDDGSINGTVTDPSIPVPDLNHVPMGALVCGGVSEPTVGTLFLVDFINEGGARYACLSAAPVPRTVTLDATNSVSIGPSASNPIELGPAPAKKLARVGDQLTVYWPEGLLTGSLVPIAGPPAVPIVDVPIQILTPAPALISYGSDKVLA